MKHTKMISHITITTALATMLLACDKGPERSMEVTATVAGRIISDTRTFSAGLE